MRLRWNVQKNNNLVSWLENLGKTAALLFVATIINIFMLNTETVASNASEIYVLAVLLTSLWTNGFIWGLIASIFGVFGTTISSPIRISRSTSPSADIPSRSSACCWWP